jgi:hypothetical protein
MGSFFAANTTRAVTGQMFLSAAGVAFEEPQPGEGAAYLVSDMGDRLETAVIVYGTSREAGANRFAAERERDSLRQGPQREVPVYKDFEATDALLAHKDVIFIGRPESNSALAAWQDRIGLRYSGAAFAVEGRTYASERDAIVFASRNPSDPAHMVLVYAGNSPLEVVRSLDAHAEAPWIVLEAGSPFGPSAPRAPAAGSPSPSIP